MSYKIKLKNVIFRSSDSSNSTEKDKHVSFKNDFSPIKILENPINDINHEDNPKFEINHGKKVTISEYMNNKIDDPDTAIENLKKELEKNLVKYNK